MSAPGTPPPRRSAAPHGYHLDGEGLLVPDTKAGASPALFVGLWIAEAVFIGLALVGILLRPWLPETFGVVTAFVWLLLFLATTALHSRARLRPAATVAEKIGAVAGMLVAIAWAVWLGLSLPSLAVSKGIGPRILLAVAGEAALMVAAVLAYRGRMFHWRKPWVAPPR
ncbi:hypothetical protein [Frondihabitans cladoniiphilus]|uniref:Uncharacterized protein n=1 Tax=Frondihabitans cladoniiphilus TaxID=715785 RepID=A0ABP8VQ83_9MICO